MTAQDHIVAWIESSRSHYDRLLTLTQERGETWCVKAPGALYVFDRAARLVSDAYREMIRDGDASRDDPYSPADLVLAVSLVLLWELEA